MKILFNDIIQYSDASENIKSPMLSETTYIEDNQLIINFDNPRPLNSIGIGNVDYEAMTIYDGWKADAIYNDVIDGGHADTIFENILDSLRFIISFNDVMNTVFIFRYEKSGLYVMPKTITASIMTINSNININIIGRIGAGMAINIPTAIAKEPSFNSTSEPRTTLSGQLVNGVGGYNYKTISLDSRYKINSFGINELKEGYKYIGMGYPFFIDLSVENYKLPYSKLYANERNQRSMSFESGIYRYLYSRRWEFEERF
jgi:hypothetical protein